MEAYIFNVATPPIAWIIVGLIAAILIAVFTLLVAPIVFLKIEISNNSIKVSAPPLYGFSADKSDVEWIMLLDLDKHKELQPALRMWGHGIPGCLMGWFRLRNGASAFLVKTSNLAVVFKLRDSRYLILTPKDLDGFLNVLERLGWIK